MLRSLQLLTFLVMVCKTGEAFVPSQAVTSMRTPALSPWNDACQSSSSSLAYARHDDDHEQDPDEMRKEIAAMRTEALQKLQVLQEQMAEFEVERQVAEAEAAVSDAIAVITKPTTTVEEENDSSSFPQTGKEVFLDLMERELAALEEVNNNVVSSDSSASATEAVVEAEEAVSTQQQQQSSSSPSQAEHLRRLDDTRWRVMLNIGREPGTWMPKEWGASGDRLHLHLELEFSSDALLATTTTTTILEGEDVKEDKKKNQMNDPGDDFLNGRSNTKSLKVVQNEGSMSPTMTEGSRKVRVTNGGWRVAPFEGPMATTVLRFYVELEEQASHQGSDVWCPAGRVYCTCGYFPMYHDPITGLVSTCSIPTAASTTTSNLSPVSLKAALKEEQEQIAKQYEFLARANYEDPAILSWDKLKRYSKMMKLKQEATKLAHKRYEWSVKEPDKAMLRLSQDQQVGLTKEGGVCCKVHKGLSMEYHMLGKFEIASMQNRDHKDYRELLMP